MRNITTSVFNVAIGSVCVAIAALSLYVAKEEPEIIEYHYKNIGDQYVGFGVNQVINMPTSSQKNSLNGKLLTLMHGLQENSRNAHDYELDTMCLSILTRVDEETIRDSVRFIDVHYNHSSSGKESLQISDFSSRLDYLGLRSLRNRALSTGQFNQDFKSFQLLYGQFRYRALTMPNEEFKTRLNKCFA
jgi:hypothetical protein